MNCLEAIGLAMEGGIVAREDLPNEIYFKSPDGEFCVYDQNEGEYYDAMINQEDIEAEWIGYQAVEGETFLQFFMKMFAAPECPDGCEEDCCECCGGEDIECPVGCGPCPGNAGKYPECEGCEGCDWKGGDPEPVDDDIADILIAVTDLADRLTKIENDKAAFVTWKEEMASKIAGLEAIHDITKIFQQAQKEQPRRDYNEWKMPFPDVIQYRVGDITGTPFVYCNVSS